MAGHSTTTDRDMRRGGFLLVAEAARKISMTPHTIYRWIADGKVEGLREGYRRYVRWSSVLKHLGRDAAKLRGLSQDAVWVETRED